MKRQMKRPDVVCAHGTAMDVHCCNCHSGFIFDLKHECPPDPLPSPLAMTVKDLQKRLTDLGPAFQNRIVMFGHDCVTKVYIALSTNTVIIAALPKRSHWIEEALARKRTALLGEPWEAQRYQHLKCESRTPDGDGAVSSCIPADSADVPRTSEAGSEPADSLPSLVLQGIKTRYEGISPCGEFLAVDSNRPQHCFACRYDQAAHDIKALVTLCERQDRLWVEIGKTFNSGGMHDPVFLTGAIQATVEHNRLLIEEVARLAAQVAQQATEIKDVADSQGLTEASGVAIRREFKRLRDELNRYEELENDVLPNGEMTLEELITEQRNRIYKLTRSNEYRSNQMLRLVRKVDAREAHIQQLVAEREALTAQVEAHQQEIQSWRDALGRTRTYIKGAMKPISIDEALRETAYDRAQRNGLQHGLNSINAEFAKVESPPRASSGTQL